jgi:hypothetical protein
MIGKCALVQTSILPKNSRVYPNYGHVEGDINYVQNPTGKKVFYINILLNNNYLERTIPLYAWKRIRLATSYFCDGCLYNSFYCFWRKDISGICYLFS